MFGICPSYWPVAPIFAFPRWETSWCRCPTRPVSSRPPRQTKCSWIHEYVLIENPRLCFHFDLSFKPAVCGCETSRAKAGAWWSWAWCPGPWPSGTSDPVIKLKRLRGSFDNQSVVGLPQRLSIPPRCTRPTMRIGACGRRAFTGIGPDFLFNSSKL